MHSPYLLLMAPGSDLYSACVRMSSRLSMSGHPGGESGHEIGKGIMPN